MLPESLFASRRPMAILDNRLTYLGKPEFLVFIISPHYLPKNLTPSTESGQFEPFWSPLLKGQFLVFSAEEIFLLISHWTHLGVAAELFRNISMNTKRPDDDKALALPSSDHSVAHSSSIARYVGVMFRLPVASMMYCIPNR